ncbi:MAG: signal peptidase II [Chloroflexi bacterium OHK40]
MRVGKQLVVLLVSAAGAVLLDALTKGWAERSLELYQPVPIVGAFARLTLSYNTGVAFSLFTNSGPLPAILSGGIILGFMIWISHAITRGALSTRLTLPLGLILGGGLGNFIDRLPDGRVTDFLDVGLGASRWPTFNLADIFLNIAVATILITLVRRPDVAQRDQDYHPRKNDGTHANP